MNANYLSFLGLLIVGCTAQVDLGDRSVLGGSTAVVTGGSGSGGQPGTQPAAGGRTALMAVCGNGVLESVEQCDDGNTISGDGCSATCQTEAGFRCTGSPSVCISMARCGNGIVESGETCDDGNALSGDGCSSACQTEAGWYCPAPGQPCIQSHCGDGIIEGSEQCDLGAQNGVSASGCTANCQFPGYCGDGVVQAPEQCDYGTAFNDGSYGGCTSSCKLAPYCGDEIMQGPEECDYGTAGNDGSYGSCTSSCKLAPYCGDGIVQTQFAEECDMGSQNGSATTYCTKNCRSDYPPGP